MPTLPTGTVTFLFSDVEGSSRRLENDQAEAGRALAGHHEIFRAVVAAHRGVIFETVGDAVYAAFAKPSDAAACAIDAHGALATHDWNGFESLLVRIAIHTGEVEARGRHYFGPALFRCARLQTLGWGGQTLVSAATARLLRGALAAGVTLVDRGIYPLKDLIEPEQVFELVDEVSNRELRELRSTQAHANNLPAQLSSFVGREADLEALEALVQSHSLVTITGPAGTGKTRLALEAAGRLLGEHPDGAWFVDLAPVRTPDLALAAIASTIGVREQPPAPLVDTLAEHARSRRLLLVLDNFEQVVEAAPAVGHLLGAPHLHVIATSREALRLRGEQEFQLSPLAVPRFRSGLPTEELERSSSVRLFVDRAREVLPSFALTPTSTRTVAEICRRLDGLPLAIELAAAMVRMLTPEQMLDRLGRRLDLLAARNRDLPERQRTLRAALAWSHELLAPEEARAFAGLAVFVDGFTLTAAEAVIDDLGWDVLGLVGTLLDKSLLVRTFDAQGEARFRMLETIRDFGLERLRDSSEFERRELGLVAWALTIVNVGSGIRWTDALATLDAFEAERGNIDEALRWLDKSGRTEEFVQLVSAASAFWLAGHHLSDARPWLSRGVDMRVRSPSLDTARLLRNAASVEHQLGASARALELIDRSISDWALVGDDAGLADALRLRGTFLLDRGEFGAARTTLAEAVALALAAGDDETRRRCLADLAKIAMNEGDNLGAEELFQELLEACSVAGDLFGVGIAHGNLAFVLALRGEVTRADREAREAVRFFTEIGDTDYLGWSFNNLAGVLTEAGRLEDALPIARQALGMAWEIGGVDDVAASIETLSSILSGSGDARRAVTLMTAAQRIRAEAGRPIMGSERVRLADRFERARETLGDDFDSTIAAATARSVEEIVRDELPATGQAVVG
jgi:predicted ATPase/class 3 adenylate cyclase